MDARRRNLITWTIVALAVLAVALMLGGTLQRTVRVTLPAPEEEIGQSEVVSDKESTLPVIEVTPETVQAVVATLARPMAYRRMVTVELFWSGGSGSYETTAAISSQWTKTSRVLPDRRTRHSITDGERTYIWYNTGGEVYTAPAGEISADNEQYIPTYEDILQLPVETITAADYRTLSGVNCIYVETNQQENGYVLRYWVSVDTGLLVSAEKLLDGETVYRMSALTLEQTLPTAKDFTLPDGTVLAEP